MAEATGKSPPPVHLCGVPSANCGGRPITTNGGMRHKEVTKAHADSELAFACHVKYLISLGYTKIDSRAYAPPDGGPVRILTKPSRFGAKLRSGKAHTRYMPHAKGTRQGTIASL